MLIFDGDCGSCTAIARWLESRLRTPVPVVRWQDVADLGELGLTPADVTTAMWWVDVYGRRYRGAAAAARVLRLGKDPLPAAGILLDVPPFSWLARAASRFLHAGSHLARRST
jgi:predicted DCC family thiol-disulfide oxidoreductase YuxK